MEEVEEIKEEQEQKEEEKEYTSDEYRQMFIERRAKYDKKLIHKGSIECEKILKQAYDEVLEQAVGGDVVAQDLLSYWLKHGNLAIPENIELSMKWLMLAGASGNKHSIDKLTMLFSFIYDSIVMTEDFQIFADDNDLTEQNYKYFLGQVICQYIIQTMPIDAFDVSQEKLIHLPFNSVSMNKFSSAANKSIEPVVELLKKANDGMLMK